MEYKELIDILDEEKSLYFPNSSRKNIISAKLIHKKRYQIWMCIRSFRLAKYYSIIMKEKNSQYIFNRIMAKAKYRYYAKKNNIFGEKCGIQIVPSTELGRNVELCHGGIVINGIIGNGCIFHGNNIIGNKGSGRENERPTLADGVDVGAGAVIIGDVFVSEFSIIGANAVVTKSFEKPRSVIAGVPAKEIG